MIRWVLALLIVIALVIYHLSVKRTASMTVCNSGGEQKQLDMDLKFYRHIIGGTTVKGTVEFDGEKYMDQISINKTLSNASDSKSLNSWWKSKGLLNTCFWLVPSESTDGVMERWNEAYSKQIHFIEIGPSLDAKQVLFFHLDAELQNEDGSVSGVPYVGPAETLEQAQNVAEELGYLFEDGKLKYKSETF